MAEDKAHARSALSMTFDHIGADRLLVAVAASCGDAGTRVLSTSAAGEGAHTGIEPAASPETTAVAAAARTLSLTATSRPSPPSHIPSQTRGKAIDPVSDDDRVVAL